MTPPAPAILLVKTSSLGDVVHNLPVVSDIRRAFPGAVVDWAVERSFAALPALHPAVRHVLPCAPRRWRRELLRATTWNEIGALRRRLHATRYDFVIDTQGLLKSALIARLAPGERHGLDWVSSREPLRWLYDRVHRVPWGQHAVTRNRALAAAVLGYAITGDPDYGIAAPAFPPNPQEDDSPADDDRPWLDPASRYTWAPPAPYAVLLHGTSAERKQWPEHQWKKLAAQLGATGVACVLPWGSDAEHARSESIAQNVPHAIVPPRLGLRTLSGLLGHARVVVGVDTGLTHLAAALRTPTVGIYVATEPAATGVLAPGFGVNLGGKGRTVTLASVLGTIRDVTT